MTSGLDLTNAAAISANCSKRRPNPRALALDETEAVGAAGLLRARCERPRGCTTEQRDELPTFHF